MKRRTFLALGLTALLSIPFATTAFAEEPQYTVGQEVRFSGQTDFDYYYTYTVDNKNYKCFSVVENGKRYYAAVYETLYEYCRNAFGNQSVTLSGKYQRTAEDGSPIISFPTRITTDDEGKEVVTSLADCIWNANCGSAENPNFLAFYYAYNTGTITAALDNSYITIDSNPLNVEQGSIVSLLTSDYQSRALNEIKTLNAFLGLPDWLYKEMMQTRAIDGRQKEIFDNVTVTWTYHPDKGLEVMYRKN